MQLKGYGIIFLISCFSYTSVFAQGQKHRSHPEKRHGHGVIAAPPVPQIFVEVSRIAEFPGGNEALQKYLTSNIRYPAVAREDAIQGSVTTRFMLDTAGHVTRAEILRDVGGGCGKEVLRVLKSMPQWKPYIYNGRPVPYVVLLKTKFRLVE